MPRKGDTRAFEAALQAILAPLARYAEARGLRRAEFSRLVSRAARGGLAHVPPSLPYDAAVRIVSRWSMDPTFSFRSRARALESQGPRSFAALVKSARAGSPAVARRALLAAGIIREDPQGRLRLMRTAYVPVRGEEEKAEILGRAAAEFLRVVTHNSSAPPGESFLQRSASYDNIGAFSLMMLRDALRREGLRALGRANALLARSDRDRTPSAPGGRRTRVSFGVYMLEEPVAATRSRKK
jgi:hypothetical protein